MKIQNLDIRFCVGYGGQAKITARIDGEEHVIEIDHARDVLLKCAEERGYTIAQTKRQKYPRIIING